DLRAGQRAGCRVVLVLTGHGRRSESRLREAAITPDWIATDLPDAVSWFIDHHVSTFQTKNN
ncbi:MAG: HAD hydrolase-like protein, partial [Proteobacteria bacterium]|nr:HAD hydrolase-like protein [Pseudomonadota bacterium]